MTTPSKISPDWSEQIREWAAFTPSVEAVYLFGSRARETHKPTSDLDLAIIVDSPDGKHDSEFIENKRRWQRGLEQRLGGVAVHISPAHEDGRRVVAAAVEREGVLIYARNRTNRR